jgi:hypothetical protein
LVSDLSPTLSPWQRDTLIKIFGLYETQAQTLSEYLSRERKAQAANLFPWQVATVAEGVAILGLGYLLVKALIAK